MGVAALAILVYDPQSVYDPSFQLTFLSVAAIAGIGVPLLERTSEPYREALRLVTNVGYDQALAPKRFNSVSICDWWHGRLGRLVGKPACPRPGRANRRGRAGNF